MLATHLFMQILTLKLILKFSKYDIAFCSLILELSSLVSSISELDIFLHFSYMNIAASSC